MRLKMYQDQDNRGRGRARIARLLLPVLLAVLSPAVAADGEVVAYRAGKIIRSAGEAAAAGILIVRDGKIEDVLAADAKTPEGAKVVELPGAVVLPGLVNPLSGISQVNFTSGPGRASQSNSSPSDGRKAVGLSSLNLKHEVYRRLGRTGYTTFAVVPNDTRGLIAGQASVIRPALGKEKEPGELVLEKSAYLLLGFSSGKTWYDAGLRYLKKAVDDILKEKAAKKKAEEDARKKAEEAKKKASQPSTGEKKPAPAPPAVKPAAPKPAPKPKVPDPLVQLFKGEKKAFVRVTSPAALAHFFAFFDKLPIKFQFVLVTGPQPPEIVEMLIERRKQITAVILEPRMGRIPETSIYVNTARLFLRSGMPVAFVPLRDTIDGHREIFFHLAAMVKSGVLPHEALAGVTSVPADLVGLGAKVGSLKKGGLANFACYDRDPLSGTARLLSVYVEGRKVFEDDPSTGELSGEAIR
ncbi:MAG: hypothetical protein OSB83_01095 [Planctomycetota bacterium]|nr:hypothetical protein [Planctomycetota bacterium]